jgi:hypothetical protein
LFGSTSTPHAELFLGFQYHAPSAAAAAAAAAADQRVIVACHHPLAPGSAPEQYLAWNHQELLALLEQHAGTFPAL